MLNKRQAESTKEIWRGEIPEIQQPAEILHLLQVWKSPGSQKANQGSSMEGNRDSKERSTAVTPTGSEGWEQPQAEISNQGIISFGKEALKYNIFLCSFLWVSVGFC